MSEFKERTPAGDQKRIEAKIMQAMLRDGRERTPNDLSWCVEGVRTPVIASAAARLVEAGELKVSVKAGFRIYELADEPTPKTFEIKERRALVARVAGATTQSSYAAARSLGVSRDTLLSDCRAMGIKWQASKHAGAAQ